MVKNDETRGRGQVNPISTYKKDALLQVRVESRYLATLHKWMIDSGMVVPTISGIIQIMMDVACDNLKKQGVQVFESTGEARNYLSVHFPKKNFNPGDQGSKNLHHNLVLDDRRGIAVESKGTHSDVVKEAVERYHELERDQREKDRIAQEKEDEANAAMIQAHKDKMKAKNK